MLSEEQFIEEEGCVCPACGSHNLWFGDAHTECGGAFQSMSCEECKAEWTTHYTMTGYIFLETED
jgi:transposase-like protein